MFRFAALLPGLVITAALLPAQTGSTSAMNGSSYPVIEFRRYTIKQGERPNFARRFESYFPEAIQQTGAIVAGEFLERANSSMFTWIRGFHDLDDRARLNAALYYGPVWKEHRTAMNELLLDSDNVLLLQPLDPRQGIAILPAVDSATETGGAAGVVIAQIFAVKPDAVRAFSERAESAFAGYCDAGARAAGSLVSLDAKNNFPQLPIRTDGPYLVWLGILKDDRVLEDRLRPLAEQASQSLFATGMLRARPEFVVLDPAPRSRLRWLPEWK